MAGRVRAMCAGIVETAAGCVGMPEAEIWRMSPAELERALERAEKRESERMARMDMLAWMIGQYAAMGACAPGKYPERPCIVYEKARDEESMKRVLAGAARRTGTVSGGDDG